MQTWLPALRIAWREAWRSKGRSTLVVALIGLPVLALAFAAVSFDSFRLTTEQQLDREIGAADALMSWQYDGPVSQPADGYGAAPVAAGGFEETQPPVTGAELREVLPPGSRAVPELNGDWEMRTATGVGVIPAERADLTDPIHEGRLVLRDGRAPAAGDEVALTREAGSRLDASIGDTVEAADGSRSWLVVGIVENPDSLRERMVFHPGDLRSGPAVSWLVDTVEPVTWEEVQRLNEFGITVRSRAVVLDPPPPEQVHETWREWSGRPGDGQALAISLLVGGLGMLEVVLLAGPAFAVGARRRQRELALVAVSGGTPAHQRRIVLADGLVLGLVGAVAGIALGALVAIAGLPLLEEHLYDRRAGGLRLWPQVLAGLAGLAILTGLLAALVPAAVAARQNVVMALAGRRGVVRSRKRWLVLGIVVTVLGAVVAGAGAWQIDASIVLAGLIASQLGMVLCTPALVGLVARLGRFLPVAPRIALRDTARNRAAAAPAISAVMAAVAGSLAVGMFTIGDQARFDAGYEPGMPLGYALVRYQMWDNDGVDRLPADQQGAVAAAMQDTLPAERVVEVSGLACPGGGEHGQWCYAGAQRPPENECPYWDRSGEGPLTAAEQREALADPRCEEPAWSSGPSLETIVDDGSLLPVLTGASGDDAAAAAAVLRAGGAVVSDPWLLLDGEATVEFWTGEETGDEPSARLTVPAHVLTTGEVSPWTLFLSPELAAAAGFEVEPVAAVAVTSRIPSVAEQDALNAAVRAVNGNLWGEVERGNVSYDDPTALILAIAAGVIALGAAGIATGLAAADRRPDLSTLGAVGASPRVRRLLSLSQSGVIAGLGAVLGSVAGIGAALSIMVAMNRRIAGRWPAEEPYSLFVPWQILAVVLVAVPVVAMLGAGLLTRSRLPIERRVA
jgi:putative ABC transport system permease protein